MVADIATTTQGKWTKWKAWTSGRLRYEHQFGCVTRVLRAMHEVRWQTEGFQKLRSSYSYRNQLQPAQTIQHRQTHEVRHALKSTLPVITQRRRRILVRLEPDQPDRFQSPWIGSSQPTLVSYCCCIKIPLMLQWVNQSSITNILEKLQITVRWVNVCDWGKSVAVRQMESRLVLKLLQVPL